MKQPGSLPNLDYYTLCSHHVREMLREDGEVTLTARELRPPEEGSPTPGVRKRSEAEKLGLCKRCVRVPPEPGFKYCAGCRKARAEASAQAKRRRVENGQCIACTAPVEHGTLRCRRCHDKESKRKRALRAKGKQAQKPTDKITASRTGASSAHRGDACAPSAEAGS